MKYEMKYVVYSNPSFYAVFHYADSLYTDFLSLSKKICITRFDSIKSVQGYSSSHRHSTSLIVEIIHCVVRSRYLYLLSKYVEEGEIELNRKEIE